MNNQTTLMTPRRFLTIGIGIGGLAGILVGVRYITQPIAGTVEGLPPRIAFAVVGALIGLYVNNRLVRRIPTAKVDSAVENLAILMTLVAGVFVGIGVYREIGGLWGIVAIVLIAIGSFILGQLLSSALAGMVMGAAGGFFFGVPLLAATVGFGGGAAIGGAASSLVLRMFTNIAKEAVNEASANPEKALTDPEKIIEKAIDKTVGKMLAPMLDIPALAMTALFRTNYESVQPTQEFIFKALQEVRNGKKRYPIYFDPTSKTPLAYLPTLPADANGDYCVACWMDAKTDTPMFDARLLPVVDTLNMPKSKQVEKQWQERQQLLSLLSTANILWEEVETIGLDADGVRRELAKRISEAVVVVEESSFR